MQIINHLSSKVNSIHLSDNVLIDDKTQPIASAPSLNYKPNQKQERVWLSKDEFESANRQKREWFKETVIRRNLTNSEVDAVYSVMFRVEPKTGRGNPSIGTIREDMAEKQNKNVSYTTVQRALKRAVKKEAITIIQIGKNQTNLYILNGYEYKSETCSSVLLYDLTLRSLRDLNNKQTYDEYVSLSANSDLRSKARAESQKPKNEPKPESEVKTKQSKHISEEKLNGPDPDEEVIRVGIAWMLSEPQIKYAVMRMRQRDTIKTTPARFLASMASKLAKGGGAWSMDDFVDEEKERRKLLEMRAREQMEMELKRQNEKIEDDAIDKLKQTESCRARVKETLAKCGLKRDYLN